MVREPNKMRLGYLHFRFVLVSIGMEYHMQMKKDSEIFHGIEVNFV